MDLPAVQLPDLTQLPLPQLQAMQRAGEEALVCTDALERGGLNVVGEMLRGQGTFYEFNHYPANDVLDSRCGSQYYYHAHRGETGEHGHFHTFFRTPYLASMMGQADAQLCDMASAKSNTVHLIAISMDRDGHMLGLFSTNQWVTAEHYVPADKVLPHLGNFAIQHANPSWPTNRWITAVMRLFGPEIAALLSHRDACFEAWRAAHPGEDVFDHRPLEVPGEIKLTVPEQIARVDAALAAAN